MAKNNKKKDKLSKEVEFLKEAMDRPRNPNYFYSTNAVEDLMPKYEPPQKIRLNVEHVKLQQTPKHMDSVMHYKKQYNKTRCHCNRIIERSDFGFVHLICPRCIEAGCHNRYSFLTQPPCFVMKSRILIRKGPMLAGSVWSVSYAVEYDRRVFNFVNYETAVKKADVIIRKESQNND